MIWCFRYRVRKSSLAKRWCNQWWSCTTKNILNRSFLHPFLGCKCSADLKELVKFYAPWSYFRYVKLKLKLMVLTNGHGFKHGFNSRIVFKLSASSINWWKLCALSVDQTELYEWKFITGCARTRKHPTKFEQIQDRSRTIHKSTFFEMVRYWKIAILRFYFGVYGI